MTELDELKLFKELVRRGMTHNEATSFIANNKNLTLDSEIFESTLCTHFEKLDAEEHAEAERLTDLEERGFFDGTDDPWEVERLERAAQFQDKLDMFRNEY